VDRHPHERRLDDRPSLERARKGVALEAVEPRPQPDVHRRRVLRLQPTDALQGTGQRHAQPLEQQLARQQGAVELAPGERAGGQGRNRYATTRAAP
jgi:hypothetical protein